MTPRCMYLYYIWKEQVGGNDAFYMYHYYYANKHDKIKPEDLEYLVNELVENARGNPAGQVPPPTGQYWDFVVWHRKSYVVFVIDVENIEFDQNNPITVKSYPNKPNYSFTNFGTFTIPSDSGTGRVWVAHCKNRMRTQSGNDIGKATERFTITLNTTPQITLERRPPFLPDDGGNNMGPPVPPP